MEGTRPGTPAPDDARGRARGTAGRPSPGGGRRHSHQRKRVRRAALALGAVAAVEAVGTVGFHAIEGVGWINAFYFESMLATGQGPPFALTTDSGKIFASVMAFVSVGSVLSAVLFVLGPILSRIWRSFVEDVETEARRLGRGLETEARHLEEDLR